MTAPRTVLFICVENACRSLMAEAIFNAHPPPGWIATSAGTEPAVAANPRTGPMLAEIGFTLPAHAPQLLTREMMDAARQRVTMGCLDDASCPAQSAESPPHAGSSGAPSAPSPGPGSRSSGGIGPDAPRSPVGVVASR